MVAGAAALPNTLLLAKTHEGSALFCPLLQGSFDIMPLLMLYCSLRRAIFK